MKQKTRAPVSKPTGFVLGRVRFEKILAVEGCFLTDEQRAMFEEFDRLGLTADERRKAIFDKHVKKA